MISPLKELGGWAEEGGIYRYKFMFIRKVLVVSCEFFIEISRSKKCVCIVGSSMIHFKDPQLFSLFLISCQVLSLLCPGG